LIVVVDGEMRVRAFDLVHVEDETGRLVDVGRHLDGDNWSALIYVYNVKLNTTKPNKIKKVNEFFEYLVEGFS
jgi:hypothetical protein